jgi:hypothetical protein
VILFFSLITTGYCDENISTINNKNEILLQQLKKIRTVLLTKDLQICNREIEHLEQMVLYDDNIYVVFMCDVVQMLYPFNDGKKYDRNRLELGIKYARKVIQKEQVQVKSLAYQWTLLNTVLFNETYMAVNCKNDQSDIKNFSSLRKWQVEQMMRIWEKIDKKIDLSFSIQNHKDAFKPLISISPFYHTTGMDPNDIFDETERKKCLDYLVKQEKLIFRQNEQDDAIQFKKNYRPNFYNAVVKLYSEEPLAINELEILLKEYNIDDNFAKEILDVVKRNGKNK